MPARSPAFPSFPSDLPPWERPPTTWWALFRDSYLTFDRRTLGFARILLGFLLIADLVRRTPTWLDMYSDQGILPSQLSLAHPQNDQFSVFHAFSSAGELWALWAVGLAVFVCLLVGYRTKVAQIAALVFVTSMNCRVLLIENGGYPTQNLLLLWTAFLPMGDRFSVDALLASWRASPDTTEAELNDRSLAVDASLARPHVSLAGLAIVLQVAAIYFFNVVHKTGPAWRTGTAVHYVIYIDRMITPVVAAVRDHLPNAVIILLSKGTLVIESAIVACALIPIGRAWARRGVVLLIAALHLGIGLTFMLGPFPWSCCLFGTLFLGREDWELAAATMRRERRARVVLYRRGSRAAFAACRLLKRLDRFDLLSFRAADRRGLHVEDPRTGAVSGGALAFADVLAALPLGPAIAWIPRLPGVRPAVDAILAAVDRADPSRWLSAPRRVRAGSGSPLGRGAGLAATALREGLALVMMVAAVNQAAVELWVLRPLEVRQSEAMAALTHEMRFLQGWFMFSPDPTMEDGTLVVDAVTADGRRVDPFTGKEPDFDLAHAKGLGLNQIWGDYFFRMRLPDNAVYRDALRDYLLRYPERTGRADDAIAGAEVYWVEDLNPRWNQTESSGSGKVLLFAFGAPR